MKRFLLIICFFLSLNAYSQYIEQLSDGAEISIITCGPGNTELYEAFGHSAIRIVDFKQGIDEVYNYGVFDFNAPNFYGNFVKGNMKYKLGRYPFHYFLNSYNAEGRWVKEQILNLSQKEKQAFLKYLETNLKPENASYLYDPYFNNCSTIPRDIIKKVLTGKLVFKGSTKDDYTLRKLMSDEIPWNTWGSFGINIALGNKLDSKTSYEEYMYLPDYLLKSLNEAYIVNNEVKIPLIKHERTIINFEEKEQKVSFFNPLLIFSILLLLTIFITYKDHKNNTRSKWFDFMLFFITGIIGCLIVFLWFFTNHSTAPNNFNFLWAFGPNLIVSFYLLKNRTPLWATKYFLVLLLFLITLVILWGLQIQVFSTTIIPIILLLGVRYYYLIKR